MTPTAALLGFAFAAALLTITPGLDTALVLRTAVSESRRSAFAAGVGICAGCLVWATLVALGVGALLAASEAAYTALRWLGAAYLVWLGIGLLMRRRLPEPGAVAGAGANAYAAAAADADTAADASAAAIGADAAGRTATRDGSARWFGRGVLTNVLNPKVGAFYVTFLPPFVPHGVDPVPFMLLLGTIHAGLGVAWFSLLIAATRALGGALARPVVSRWIDRVTGTALVAFGARLAWPDGR